jgi:hypothetical protein
MGWLWKLFEPYVQAAITHRIIMFHDALVERQQIPPITKENKLQPRPIR